MKKAAVLLCALLAGCSVGQVKFDNTGEKFTSRQSAGIPYVLSLTGTATAISPHVSITARHVADSMIPADHVLAWHHKCDVAIIAADNEQQGTFPAFAKPEKGHAQFYGYSANTRAAVSGEGEILGVTKYKGCLVYRADAGAMQGMSGGPVVQDGKVVGIIVGLDMNRKEVIFVGMDIIGNWLNNLNRGENPKP
jgi:hypothetical protein